MAVRDRLLELEYNDEGSSQTLYEVDIEDKDRNYDQLFFDKINQLKTNLSGCYDHVNTIKEFQKRALLSMFKDSDIARTNDLIDNLINTTNSKIQFIINEIKGLDYDTCRKNFTESEVLMRKSQQKIMMNKVKDFIKEFTMIQQEYEKQIQERIIRQHNIVNPNEAFNSKENNYSQYQVFADEILSSKLNNNKRKQNEAQSIYKNMKAIEKSITDLFTLSKEIQIMLESQNEKINEVTVKIEDANNDIEEGNEELASAIEKGKSIRRTYKYITYIVASIASIAIIYLALIFLV
ncbi:t-SNARE [Piromyces finnis]|uniref:t-SNARE n=1 Tax=Piromyces finnis TaxID=1754191 RepID=A0A1Y1V9J7_9FUNG|nr:t-SNARE [Piromyces finnis]|eukprot:ORX50639.1 t-SNARE [Piromyces finnis]